MKPEFRELRVAQIDRSLEAFSGSRGINRPQRGWLRAVREALGISIREVAREMQRTPQTVASFEKSEAANRITLQALQRYAEAMDCELVYAILPKAGSLKKSVENRVRRQVETDVRAVEHTMALENQATAGTPGRIGRETKQPLG